MKQGYAATFAPLLVEIEQALRDYIKRQPRQSPLLWSIVDYHFGWSERPPRRDGELPNLGGKRVRPLIVLLVARALTGQHRHALPAALAIEIIHNFTLIHDDVMDQSLERRHRETVWARWGTAQAINAGDGLFALGLAALNDLVTVDVDPTTALEASRALLSACLATVEGQMLDIDFETRLDVTPQDYLTMVANKSGALIACGARLGAILSSDDPAIRQRYGDFGLSLGIAFQMWDDYLGIWGSAATGKSATSDIERRKKSYPILVAFERAGEAERQRLLRVYRQATLTPEDVADVHRILDAVDAADATRTMIEHYYRAALSALDAIPVVSEEQAQLRELASFLVARAY